MNRPSHQQTARYTRIPLPPYSYVPGVSPHPVSDPAGHHHGVADPVVRHFHAQRWNACQPYLYGIDLFNAGFYWEAHEQWEAVWHAVGRRGPIAALLKGLIKLAAAGVKLREDRVEGVRRHAARAAALFRSVAASADPALLCGLPVQQLAIESDALAKSAAGLAGGTGEPCQRRLPVVLAPGRPHGFPSASA
jgi:hypothetical protein